nr:hypothetical protein [Rubrobacter tropicus]
MPTALAVPKTPSTSTAVQLFMRWVKLESVSGQEWSKRASASYLAGSPRARSPGKTRLRK